MLLPASPWVGILFRAATRLAPLVGFLLGFLVLIQLGRFAHQKLVESDRYLRPFASITCQPPPGEDRSTFLEEVQYLGQAPDHFNLLETELPSRLATAFARHPWVERVERIEITPAQQVAVRLRFRIPVLAVAVPSMDRPLAVDRHGIRLPASAPTSGLPIYRGSAAPPAGPAGTPWGDPGVEAAARLASPGHAP
ncbi:hypothetical protein AYO44_05605 [Planctomycetaceae bacterium SCGC AG-212-F19]|nr:hypothetical protein AYO44_05605 [Planctomycetaceae bacterium SCGC AG-212-F19]